MSKLYPSIDPEGLVEYSVVYTDRSLNHMSQSFHCLLYTSPSPRDLSTSRMPSSA